MNTIAQRLTKLQDPAFADLTAKTIPGFDRQYFIGVRTPQLRALAKELYGSAAARSFTNELPHRYFEEYQLHSFIISREKNFEICIKETEKFLPFVNNWAVCDQLCPACFSKNKDKLLPSIYKWLESEHLYTKRFAVKMLMSHFLDNDFDKRYLDAVCGIKSEEYYMKMMIAWYIATALAKQYESTLPYLTEHRLDKWTHNKAIQKAVESRRITDEQKTYLKTLKIK
ncbi:MAG: DNA alkylation repair protein [Ruminococcus sp.]|nr:DNA alkylation repair protein [Ruminococcus sp.]